MERERYFTVETVGSLALKEDRPQPQSNPEIKIVPGLGKDLNDLPGLNVGREIDGFLGRYNKAREKGRDHLEAIQLSINELEVNLRTWTREYPLGATVLPMLISQSEEDRRRFIVNSYDGIRIIEKTTSIERNGATLKASKRIEEFFDKEDGDGIAVINSVDGWTGFVDEKGNPFEYLDHQLLVFWREAGKLRGLTLVSDLNLDQARQLSINLGVSSQVLRGKDEHGEIENIVKNPAFLKKGSQRFKTVREIAQELLVARGGRHDFGFELPDKTFKYVPVSEMLLDIERFEAGEDLLKFSPEVEEIITSLKELILKYSARLGSPILQRLIAEEIRKTALKITRALRNPPQPKFNLVGSLDLIPRGYDTKMNYPKEDNYAAELYFLKTQTMGCAIGSSFDLSFEGGLDLDSGIVSGSYITQAWSGTRRGGRGRRRLNKGGKCTNPSCGERNHCTKECYKCGSALW